MPHDRDIKRGTISADIIREIKMPPYEYQKLENGFGSMGSGKDQKILQQDRKAKSKGKKRSSSKKVA